MEKDVSTGTGVDEFLSTGSVAHAMRVRDWTDIVQDVVESDAEPDDWRAVAGNRDSGVGEDLYIGHPKSGVFMIKTYAKNPYNVRGVGTQIARKLDDELMDYLPENDRTRFAIRAAPADESEAKSRATKLEETIRVHADAPTTPDDLFADVMEALESPAYGPMKFDPRGRPEELDGLADTFEEAEQLLNSDLDDLIDSDGIDRGFM